MFQTIKSKFFLNLFIAISSLIITIVVSYMIAVSSVKSIMLKDVSSIAEVLGKSINYIAQNDKEALDDEAFKKTIHTTKVGKSGYVYIINAKGTLLVHPKKEGKSLAKTSYGSYIISHKEGGVYEYVSSTTGQAKLAAFRYIPTWNAWVVPGVNKADYFDDLKKNFVISFSIVLLFFITLLILINYITGRAILTNAEVILNVTDDLSKGDGDLQTKI